MKLPFLVVFTFAGLHANAQQTLSLRPVQDANVCYHDGYASADKNYGALNFFGASCQNGKIWGVISSRTFLQFDFSDVPADAEITSAYLMLYSHDAAGDYRYEAKGENHMAVERVSTLWNESDVTWNTQPKVDSENSVVTVSTVDAGENTMINVLPLLRHMLNNPAENFGFGLRLLNERPVSGVFFNSKEHADTSLRPVLLINYEQNVGVNKNKLMLFDSRVFPNPFTHQGVLTLSSSAPLDGLLSLYDVNGKTVKTYALAGQSHIVIERGDLPAGMYFYDMTSGDVCLARGKVVMQ